MASKYDLSHIGKRALKAIRKNGGDTFLDKVIKSRNFADGLRFDGSFMNGNNTRLNYGYGSQAFINYPCVGLCPDENGNMVWIPAMKKPIDRQDLFQITGTDFDDVEIDPFSYVDDKSDFIRQYARGLVNGEYEIGSGLDNLIREKGWNKFSKVNKDGSVSRASNVYSPYGTGGDLNDTESSHYTIRLGSHTSPPRNRRKEPYPYINVFGPRINPSTHFAESAEPGQFINPSSVLGSDLKKLKKSPYWNLEDWNMRTVKNRERYDVNDRIDRRAIVHSRGVSRGPARQYSEMNDEKGYVPYRLYLKRLDNINEMYDRSLDEMREDIIRNPKSQYTWDDWNKLLNQKNDEIELLEEKMGIK